MNNLKRLISSLLCMALLFTASVGVFAEDAVVEDVAVEETVELSAPVVEEVTEETVEEATEVEEITVDADNESEALLEITEEVVTEEKEFRPRNKKKNKKNRNND